jgi:hypothetical protein
MQQHDLEEAKVLFFKGKFFWFSLKDIVDID